MSRRTPYINNLNYELFVLIDLDMLLLMFMARFGQMMPAQKYIILCGAVHVHATHTHKTVLNEFRQLTHNKFRNRKMFISLCNLFLLRQHSFVW